MTIEESAETSPDRFPVEVEATVGLARELAMTWSESSHEGAAVELVVEAMRRAGMRATVDRSGNAVGTIGRGRAGAPRLLIDGHVDSIPLHSAERWSVDPLGGLIADGKLYGLGICDQKGSIASAVSGIAAVAERLAEADGLVAVVASVCEEHMEGAGLAEAVEAVAPSAVITTEPSDAHLMQGQRGRSKIALELIGRACHAGHVAEGINAAEALALTVAALRAAPPSVHRDLGRRDVTLIDVASWPYPSVSTVPGRALARFDCRFPPPDDLASLCTLIEGAARAATADWQEPPEIAVRAVEAEFASWTGATFSVEEYAAPWWTDDPLVARAAHAISLVGLDPRPRHYSFCTNGSYTAGVLGIPTIGFGAGEEHMAHQVDEYVTLDSLLETAQGLAAIAVELVAS